MTDLETDPKTPSLPIAACQQCLSSMIVLLLVLEHSQITFTQEGDYGFARLWFCY